MQGRLREDHLQARLGEDHHPLATLICANRLFATLTIARIYLIISKDVLVVT